MSRELSILKRVQDTLADPINERYTANNLYRILAEGQQIICKELKNYIKTETYIVPALTNEIPIGLDVLFVNRVKLLAGTQSPEVNTTLATLPIKASSLLDVKLGDNWESDVGTPDKVVHSPSITLAYTLHPTPKVDTAVRVSYVAITDGYDPNTPFTLSLPVSVDIALKMYVTGTALRENIDSKNRQAGIDELSLFSNELKTLKRNMSYGGASMKSQSEYNSAFEGSL